MILTRRSFFGLLAAPAIIRIADLMPIRALPAPIILPDLASWTIPMLPEDAVNYAQDIEVYQKAIMLLLDTGELAPALRAGYDPGGKPAGWTPHRKYLQRNESALLVEDHYDGSGIWSQGRRP